MASGVPESLVRPCRDSSSRSPVGSGGLLWMIAQVLGGNGGTARRSLIMRQPSFWVCSGSQAGVLF